MFLLVLYPPPPLFWGWILLFCGRRRVTVARYRMICLVLFIKIFILRSGGCCYSNLLVKQFPARGSTQVLLCLFPGGLWLWHFLYSVCPYPVSSLHIYTFVVSRAFMAGAASQAGDAGSSRAPGLTSSLQGSVNVHRGALFLVPQWQCISSFVFYIVILHFYGVFVLSVCLCY